MSTKKKTKYKPKIVSTDLAYLNLHKSAQCKGHPCCIHHPSKHHMVGWKLNLRSSGLMERICPHGIGHPDPDSVAYFRRVDPETKWLSVHGCDGCCTSSEKHVKVLCELLRSLKVQLSAIKRQAQKLEAEIAAARAMNKRR